MNRVYINTDKWQYKRSESLHTCEHRRRSRNRQKNTTKWANEQNHHDYYIADLLSKLHVNLFSSAHWGMREKHWGKQPHRNRNKRRVLSLHLYRLPCVSVSSRDWQNLFYATSLATSSNLINRLIVGVARQAINTKFLVDLNFLCCNFAKRIQSTCSGSDGNSRA